MQDELKPLVKEHLSHTLGISTEGIFQKVIAAPGQKEAWPNQDSLRVHIRTILKVMHDGDEVKRVAAVGDNGGSTFVYTLCGSVQAEPSLLETAIGTQSLSPTGDVAPQSSTQPAVATPMGIVHLLCLPDEGSQSGGSFRETSGNDNAVQGSGQSDCATNSTAGPEIYAAQESPDEADKRNLQSARKLKARLDLAREDLLKLESKKKQLQDRFLMLQAKAEDNRLRKTDLLEASHRLREEALQAEQQAAEFEERALECDEKAEGEKGSQQECEMTIADTKNLADEARGSLQQIHVELGI